MSNEMPTFGSMEELIAFRDKMKGKPSNKPEPSPTVKKKTAVGSSWYLYRIAEQDLTKDPIVQTDPMTYQEIHFFVRPGDTWNKILLDSKTEKEYRGPGVVVIAHDHARNEPCVHPDNGDQSSEVPRDCEQE